MASDILTTTASIEDLYNHWHDPSFTLQWNCLFLLPPWLKAWQAAFGQNTQSVILVTRDHKNIIAIAPLLYSDNKVMIIGSGNVCDYCDLIVDPRYSEIFLNRLFDYLRSKDIKEVHLNGMTEDNMLFTLLPEIAASSGNKYICRKHDVSYIKKLPSTWDEYLMQLNKKQRHEIRRKKRRLEEAGEIGIRVIENLEGEDAAIDTFFTLFALSSKNKAKFMDARMKSFFEKLMSAMSAAGLLRLFFLTIEGIPAASALCFEYNKTMYLYNSGYDPQFSSISAGFFCKAMSIRIAIERGCSAYDFLKGSESYKHRLGGFSTPVYQCHLSIR